MKTIGTVLLVVGIIILLLSLIADVAGFGATAGFGGNQIIGAVVGVIAIVAGFILSRRS